MLRKGEHLELTYRGERIAELVPAGAGGVKTSPLEALKRLHLSTGKETDYAAKTEAYLAELRADQKTWSERTQ